MIEVLGWATSRTVARQFLQTCDIATWDATRQEMVPRADVALHPFRATETISVMRPTGATVTDPFGNQVPEMVAVAGFHFNLLIYGQLEETLKAAAPGEEYWSRLKLKNYIDNKLGTAGALQNKEVTGKKLPGGYEWSIGPNKVRLYDGALVNARRNVWL